ncbi:MAG: hypothetical protein H7293_18715 [Candidatus Saccharibacteria bacterium]|nr:hypothetical protein [Rhodoferax sp.]
MNFLIDSRKGFGRFREFRVSNYQLMMGLIKYCHDHGINEILQLPDVVVRVDLYFKHAAQARDQIERFYGLTL